MAMGDGRYGNAAANAWARRSQAGPHVHGHAGTSARMGGVGTGITGRTCEGLASYDPAG